MTKVLTRRQGEEVRTSAPRRADDDGLIRAMRRCEEASWFEARLRVAARRSAFREIRSICKRWVSRYQGGRWIDSDSVVGEALRRIVDPSNARAFFSRLRGGDRLETDRS